MKNNIKKVFDVVSILALILSIGAIHLSDQSVNDETTTVIELSTQANVGYAIYHMVDGESKDNYAIAGATVGAGTGFTAGAAMAGVGAGGTALAAAQTGVKIGAIAGGVAGAIIGATIGAL